MVKCSDDNGFEHLDYSTFKKIKTKKKKKHLHNIVIYANNKTIKVS